MRRTVLIFVLSFFLITPLSFSQTEKNVHFYLGGGAAAAFGDLADISSAAPFARLGASFKPAPFSSPELEIIADFRFSRFVSGDDGYGDVQFLSAGLEARLLLSRPGTPGPYITIGGGYAHTVIDEYIYRQQIGPDSYRERVVPEITEHNPYLAPGLGYEFGGDKSLRFYVEGRLVNVFGNRIKNMTYVPLTLGLRF